MHGEGQRKIGKLSFLSAAFKQANSEKIVCLSWFYTVRVVDLENKKNIFFCIRIDPVYLKKSRKLSRLAAQEWSIVLKDEL